MTGKKWGGAQVRKARAMWRPRLPLPCCRCTLPVVPDPSKPGEGWQVDHWPIPFELGGTETWPAHARCNTSAGGKRGAQITNAKRKQRKRSEPIRRGDERMRNIRGV